MGSVELMTSAEIKQEIGKLWNEHFCLVEKNEGECLDSDQKKEVRRLMCHLGRQGERRWVEAKIGEVRQRAAKIVETKGGVR